MILPVLRWEREEDRRTLAGLSQRLTDLICSPGPQADVAAGLLHGVRVRGDEALVAAMREFTNPEYAAGDVRVPAAQIGAAVDALDPELRQALQRAIDHVRAYQEHVRPTPVTEVQVDDALLGMRQIPVSAAGLLVPGGKAAYPSSVIMLVVPAQVAGVPRICVASPPATDLTGAASCTTSSLVLAACGLLEVNEVYAIGGAQAVAALASGTAMVAPVDFIAGPGNAYVTQAKRQVYGSVGIDGLYGPSEIVVLADDTANPSWVAADLIAQAEHDPGSCVVICTDERVLQRIRAGVEQALHFRARKDALNTALREWSAAVLVADLDSACQVADSLAAEHVSLAVADPQAAVARIRHAGAFFLGGAPVASGDYYAGPSHCLPTGRTARFSSGVSVHTFLKRSSVESYPAGMLGQTIADIASLAEAEGLDGHADSVRQRGD